jgi:L-threonylcarbamoyladenylate synthase
LNNVLDEVMQDEIEKTVAVLKKGGVIIYPTDTIWGVGCDATNQKAVDRIYKIKKRVDNKSLIILVETAERIRDYVQSPDQRAIDLAESYDKPLTIIFSNAKSLAKGIAATDKSVGVRVVKDAFCAALIHELGSAIVSTSANVSGFQPPVRFQQISETMKNSVDYVVNMHREKIKELKPSRIIRILQNGDFEILRP